MPDDRKAALQKAREETDAANAAAMERMDSCSPTPTQEENDLARQGIAVEKQDDGSGPTVITRTFTANVPLGYETRSTKSKSY